MTIIQGYPSFIEYRCDSRRNLNSEYTGILPKNLLFSNGKIREDFENAANWTVTGGGTAVNDAVNYKTGTQSIRVTTDVGVYTQIQKNFGANEFPVDDNNLMRIWVYVVDPTKLTSINIALLDVTLTKDINCYFALDDKYVPNSWFLISAHNTEWALNGGMTWQDKIRYMRIRVQPVAGQIAEVSLDSFTTEIVGNSAVFITFDDSSDSIYNYAYPIMAGHGMPGTFYACTSWIGGVNQVTENNLHTLSENGWQISNHTRNHTDLTTLTFDQAKTEILAGRSDLTGWGFTAPDINHFAYPGGSHNATVIDAATAVGVLTARGINSYLHRHPIFPLDCKLFLPVMAHLSSGTHTLAQAILYINRTVLYGYFCIILCHKLVPGAPGPSEWSVADFTSLCTYIRSLRLPCLTIDQLYQLDTSTLWQICKVTP